MNSWFNDMVLWKMFYNLVIGVISFKYVYWLIYSLKYEISFKNLNYWN